MGVHIFKGMIGMLTALAVGIFVWTFVHAIFYAPDSEVRVPPFETTPTAPSTSKPARVQIPSLSIDATVQEVGITDTYRMGTPSNFKDVGWYKYGPMPGQIGSAVIDGHVDNGLALAGVFKNLKDISVSDDVYIVTRDGSKLRFVVTDVHSYPYTDSPTDLIFGQTDAARLNLITCSGTWIAGTRTYSDRLVVYTVFSNIMKRDGT